MRGSARTGGAGEVRTGVDWCDEGLKEIVKSREGRAGVRERKAKRGVIPDRRKGNEDELIQESPSFEGRQRKKEGGRRGRSMKGREDR